MDAAGSGFRRGARALAHTTLDVQRWTYICPCVGLDPPSPPPSPPPPEPPPPSPPPSPPPPLPPAPCDALVEAIDLAKFGKTATPEAGTVHMNGVISTSNDLYSCFNQNVYGGNTKNGMNPLGRGTVNDKPFLVTYNPRYFGGADASGDYPRDCLNYYQQNADDINVQVCYYRADGCDIRGKEFSDSGAANPFNQPEYWLMVKSDFEDAGGVVGTGLSATQIAANEAIARQTRVRQWYPMRRTGENTDSQCEEGDTDRTDVVTGQGAPVTHIPCAYDGAGSYRTMEAVYDLRGRLRALVGRRPRRQVPALPRGRRGHRLVRRVAAACAAAAARHERRALPPLLPAAQRGHDAVHQH